mgnify:CR=1 FL=1
MVVWMKEFLWMEEAREVQGKGQGGLEGWVVRGEIGWRMWGGAAGMGVCVNCWGRVQAGGGGGVCAVNDGWWGVRVVGLV